MHCHAAAERSPLISIAFLSKIKNLSLTQSYEYVKQQNQNNKYIVRTTQSYLILEVNFD